MKELIRTNYIQTKKAHVLHLRRQKFVQNNHNPLCERKHAKFKEQLIKP